MLQDPEWFPFFSVAHLFALEKVFCISRAKNTRSSSLINYLINKYVICQEGVPTTRWTQQAQLVLRHFVACACLALAFQSLVWLTLSPILYYQTINQGLEPTVRHISVCTRVSASALDRHTENELTDLVKIAQLAEWMTVWRKWKREIFYGGNYQVLCWE